MIQKNRHIFKNLVPFQETQEYIVIGDIINIKKKLHG